MTRHSNPHNLKVRNPAYRPAFARLDEALEKNSGGSNAGRIKLMRQAMFADVDELQKSGKIIIPKY